jgi:hypothetical protein
MVTRGGTASVVERSWSQCSKVFAAMGREMW